MRGNHMNDTTKITIGIIIGASIIAGGLYLGLKEGLSGMATHQKTITSSKQNITSTSSNTITSQPTVTTPPSSTLTPTPTPEEISWTKTDIIKALSKKTNIPEDKIKFSIGEKIEKKDKVLIKGGVSREGEMGGADFMGVIDKDGVKITYVGQGVPSCSEVDPYGYPLSWADYCINESGQTIRRK